MACFPTHVTASRSRLLTSQTRLRRPYQRRRLLRFVVSDSPFDGPAIVVPLVRGIRKGEYLPAMRDRPVLGNLMRKPQPHNRARQPEDRGQEAEGLARLPSIADTSVRNPRPVERRTVTLATVKVVDQKAKGGKPSDGDEEVGGPVDEASCEGKEPE